jgi:hypothetical protein
MCKKSLSVCIIALAAIFALVEMGSAAAVTTQVNTEYIPSNTTHRDTGDVVFQFNFVPTGEIDGMAWDGSNIWIGSDGLNMIYKCDTLGNRLDSFPAPAASATGLTWDGQYLWCADGATFFIYKMDPAIGSVIDSIPGPGTGVSCEGLAWMNDTLWNTNWNDNWIWQLDPTTGTIWGQFPTIGTGSTGLAWDWVDNCLWNSDQTTDQIYKLNPVDCTIITFFACPDAAVQDLAFDGTYLWTCGWYTGNVYKLDIGYTGIEEHEVAQPFTISLQVSPNPFKHKTDIICHLSGDRSAAELRIYDITGNEIREFTGQSSVTWDGTDHASRRLPSGVYFVKLEAEGQVQTQKLMLIR